MELRELLRKHEGVWFIVVLSCTGNLIYFGYHPEQIKRAFLERMVIDYEEIQKNNIKELEVVIEIDC